MADELCVNTGGTAIGDALWKMHQKDEWKHVNKHKEGFCWKCEKKDAVGATLVNVCKHCGRNRGKEACLVTLANKGWDICYFCGKYDWNVHHLNVRLCHKCHLDVRMHMRELRQKGGATKVDPFWKAMRRRLGKDYSILMSDGTGNDKRFRR